MREHVIKPLGLVTQPNKYGVYPPGALQRADNVVMRQVGVLQQMPRRAELLPPTFGSGGDWQIEKMHSTTRQLLLFKHERVVTLEWQTSWLREGGAQDDAFFIDLNESPFPKFNTLLIGGKRSLSSILFRGRSIFNSDYGILATDYINPQNADQRTIRYAGMVQPLLFATASTADGAAHVAATVAAYSCVLIRKYPDGYQLISEPAPILRVKNTDTVVHGGDITVRWTDPSHLPPTADRSGVREGDIIELYRTPSVESGGTFTNADPGETLYRVQTHVITAAEVAAGFANFIDKSGAEPFGPELYTNPGQEAGAAPRRRPPAAMSVAQYKGFAFYTNITYPAQWKTAWPGGFGKLDTPELRKNGIGQRRATGATFTVGSPVITGIPTAELDGVQEGQYLSTWGFTSSGLFPTTDGYAFVSAVDPVAGTITMDRNAIAAPLALQMAASDVLELDGVLYAMGSLSTFMKHIVNGTGVAVGAAPPQGFYSIVTEPSITYDEPYNELITIYDQRMLLEPSRYVQGNVSVRATNAQNYDPPIPGINDDPQVFAPTREPNLTTWSWADQPEAVTPGNSTSVGYGEVHATAATRDALWFHASDGLFRLTGYGTRSSGVGAQFRVDLIDKTVVIAHPHAMGVLRDVVHSYTNRGLVQITDAGVRDLSNGVIGDILPGARLQTILNSEETVQPGEYFIAGDDDQDEVWLGVRYQTTFPPSPPPFQFATDYFVYRTPVQAFTKCITAQSSTAIVFAEFLHGLALSIDADGVENYALSQYMAERSVIDYQPVSAGDPLAAKQWIDCILIFDLGDAGIVHINARFNQSDVGGGYPRAKQNDSRRNVGVPRRAPAVAHTLSPGLVMDDNDVRLGRFFGLSLRFEGLSEQHLFRSVP